MKKIKIFFYSGKRGGINSLIPLIKKLKKIKQLHIKVIFSDMHLEKEFGNTFNEFNFLKKNAIFSRSLFKKDSLYFRTKSISKGLNANVEIIKKFKPNFLVLLGDRSELFSIGIPAMIYNIPIIHFYGGDLTQGCTDEQTRHAISMMSNYHFVSNEQSKKNLIKFGIEKNNIHNVGFLSLDSSNQKNFKSCQKIYKNFKLDINKKLIISILHPETWEVDKNKKKIKTYFDALKSVNENIIFIYPCSDPGYKEIIKNIKRICSKNNNFYFFKNIEANKFYNLLNCADLIIGNSSTGIIESNFFNTSSLNIGDRQKNRLRGKNIKDIHFNKTLIEKSIKSILIRKKKNSKMKTNNSHIYFKKNSVDNTVKLFKKIISKKSHKQIMFNRS